MTSQTKIKTGAWLLLGTMLVLSTIRVIADPTGNPENLISDAPDVFILNAGQYGIPVPSATGNSDKIHSGLQPIPIANDIQNSLCTHFSPSYTEHTTSRHTIGLYTIHLNLRN
jgi:hypothetical protein